MKGRNIHVMHVTYFHKKTLILTTHKQSEHERKKYPCNAGDFLSRQKQSLGKHKQSVHEEKT